MTDPTTLASLKWTGSMASPGPWDMDFDNREGGADQIVEQRSGQSLTIAFGTSNGNEHDLPLLVGLRNNASSLLQTALAYNAMAERCEKLQELVAAQKSWIEWINRIETPGGKRQVAWDRLQAATAALTNKEPA